MKRSYDDGNMKAGTIGLIVGVVIAVVLVVVAIALVTTSSNVFIPLVTHRMNKLECLIIATLYIQVPMLYNLAKCLSAKCL